MSFRLPAFLPRCASSTTIRLHHLVLQKWFIIIHYLDKSIIQARIASNKKIAQHLVSTSISFESKRLDFRTGFSVFGLYCSVQGNMHMILSWEHYMISLLLRNAVPRSELHQSNQNRGKQRFLKGCAALGFVSALSAPAVGSLSKSLRRAHRRRPFGFGKHKPRLVSY